jgi:acyl-coenzyme A synthetase/AMP-(fatty) acid ligase
MPAHDGAPAGIMSLGQSVLDHAARQPGAPALRWRDAPVSYAELAGLVRGALDDIGTHGARGPIAVTAEKSPETIALILACGVAGQAVFLPAPDLGAQAFSQLTVRAGCLWTAKATVTGTQWRSVEAGQPSPLADDVRFLLTTSGSTGAAKIVPLHATAIDKFTRWAIETFGLGPDVSVLNCAPLNFDLCLLDIWATLRAGGCVVLAEPGNAVRPRYLVSLLSACDIRVMQAVPMFFRIVAEAADGARFPAVGHVILTGDHTPRRLRGTLPGLFPSARFHNVYGCTETNDSFIHSFDAAGAAVRDVLPLGRPLPGADFKLVADDGSLNGPGTGELWVATPFQTRGYLHDQGDRFVRGPGGLTYFRTGDVVERGEDGELTLVGRTDFQVKVRGVRVGTEDVERVICEHEEVAEAGVVALPDAEAGNRLCAMVRRNSSQLTGLGLRLYCAERLARTAIPSVIHIVDGPLPRTSTGKIDRTRIREELLAGGT